jgi:gamma-glutamylcysteine synthetase
MNKRKTVKGGRNTKGMSEGWRGEKAEDTRSKKKNKIKKKKEFLISNFRRVLYVVRFLLGNSPAS